MIQRVEIQRNVTRNLVAFREVAANVNVMKSNFEVTDSSANVLAVRGGQRGRLDPRRVKGNRYCDHCHRAGHISYQCFKIIGYPNWYPGSKDNTRSKRNTRVSAYLAKEDSTRPPPDTPFDHSFGTPENIASVSSTGSSANIVDSSLVQAVAQEVMKLVQGQQGLEMQSSDSNAFAHFASINSTGSHSFVGCAMLKTAQGPWIIDTGASDHMTFDFNYFLEQLP